MPDEAAVYDYAAIERRRKEIAEETKTGHRRRRCPNCNGEGAYFGKGGIITLCVSCGGTGEERIG